MFGKKKNSRIKFYLIHEFMAEREGFEPPEQLPVHRISSAARSTTPASLLVVLALITVCKSTMFVRNDQTSSRDSVFWACILWANRGEGQGCGSSGASLGWGVACGVAGEGSVEQGSERRKSANGGRKSKCTFCSPPIYV